MAKQDYSVLIEREKEAFKRKTQQLESKIEQLEKQLQSERETNENVLKFVSESLLAIKWTIKQMQGEPLSEKLSNVYTNLKRHTAKEIALKVFEKVRNEEGGIS